MLQRVPWSGEIIDVSDPAVVATALYELREMRRRMAEFEEAAQQMLLDQMDTRGQWTMRFGDREVEGSTPGDDYYYDVEQFRKVLEAGLPEDRFNEIVTVKVTESVNRTKAKALLKVPQYEQIVKDARVDTAKRRRVIVR
jgi:hypothetical protein